jgi:hypothetical protein
MRARSNPLETLSWDCFTTTTSPGYWSLSPSVYRALHVSFIALCPSPHARRLSLTSNVFPDDQAAIASRNHICEVLSFCVQAHGYRIKYFILRNNIVAKVLRLLQCRDAFLRLVAIRFVRMCIGIKDEFYNRYMVKNNLFAELFQVFKQNKYKDNLVCSAVLELLEFVRSVSSVSEQYVRCV